MKLEDMINTIQLGDCYELIKNIPDKSIDLVYIDIPYLFADGGCNSSPLSARIKKLKTIDLANITKGIDYSIYDEIIRILKKINCFIWCSKDQILDTLNYFVNKDCMFEILTWNKTNPTPEYILQDNLGNKYKSDGGIKRDYKILKIKKGKRYIKKISYTSNYYIQCFEILGGNKDA